jgi:hypothetical protein
MDTNKQNDLGWSLSIDLQIGLKRTIKEVWNSIY